MTLALALKVLDVAPGSPLLLQGAAASVLALHIGAGCAGVLSGAAALGFRKGGRRHRTSGDIFVVSMLIMAGIGAAVSPFLPQRSNVVPGVFTFYLVASGWMAARRRDGQIGRFEVAALLVALAATATGVAFGLQAAGNPDGLLDGEPPSMYYVFAALVGLAATLDVGMILRRGLAGAQRIARHVWRMCFALFIATASLFLGQPQLFPESVRRSHILAAPELIVLGLMIFWLIRIRLKPRTKSARLGMQGAAA